MNPLLSVIIPTHRRPEILRLCLEHLERQSIGDRLEVIVVSDGEDPETSTLFKKSADCKLWTTDFVEIPRSHQGTARNRGVARARTPLILFIGDDIFLEPDACEKHLSAHAKFQHSNTKSPSMINDQLSIINSLAVLGSTTWDPEAHITPVMRWLEESGWQFGYPKIRQHAHAVLPGGIQHSFTYTSHISIPTEIARGMPFLEDVSLYGWEDIEWGLRLRKAGVRLFYEPDAKALHHHHLTMKDSLRRMETLGRSAVEMERLEPSMGIVPVGRKRIAYELASRLPTMAGRHRKAFLLGIRAGRSTGT